MGPPSDLAVFAACRLIYSPDKGFGGELVPADVDGIDDSLAASRRLVDSSSSSEGDIDGDGSSADGSSSLQETSTTLSSASSSSGDVDSEKAVIRPRYRWNRFCCGRGRFSSGALISWGVFLLLLGVGSLIRTPYQLLMAERLKMLPGLPPYEWWRNPPDEVLLRFYLFNITNGAEFVSGQDSKLQMNEIGPFVFREKLKHTNIRFHDNGTMTYTATRSAVYLPEMNSIDLESTIVVPNLAVLGMASYLWDAPFYTRMGFNMLLRSLGSKPLTTISVQDYMWNMTDPLVHVGKTVAPAMVPVENTGALQNIYEDFVDDVSVFIGPTNGRRFFTMDRFRGNRRLGHWPGESCDTVEGATEGVSYHQDVRRDDELRYFRKTLCRVMPLHWARDEKRMGMLAMRFELPESVFDRVENATSEEDCYTLEGKTGLPSGLSDVSPCFFDFPVVASLPHFLGADPILRQNVGGMTPDRSRHGSYVVLEPQTGVPMEARARSQSNLYIRPAHGFKIAERFSGLTIPMFWAEYHQVGLPWYISGLMVFTVIVLPPLQILTSAMMLIGGSYLVWRGGKRLLKQRRRLRRSLRPVLVAARVVSCASAVAHHQPTSPPPLSSYSSLDLLPSTGSST